MILNWLKIFVYHFKQNKLFSILNVLGLSIGISGLIFAILYWNEEHSYNAWNPEKEKIFEVFNDMGDAGIWASNPAPLGPIVIKTSKDIDSYCYYNPWYYEEIVSYKGKKELINKIIDAQSNFFSFFPFEFVKGSPKTAIQDGNSMAISESTAKLLFKEDEPLGKQVEYSGRIFMIRGVYRIPGKSSLAPEVVTNLIASSLQENSDQWGNYNYGLLLKLKNPAKTAAVIKTIDRIYYENTTLKMAKEQGLSGPEFVKRYGATKSGLSSLETARLNENVSILPEKKGNYQFLVIMIGLSVLILVLSIVNYVNLTTANAIKRAKEVGVRRIIGATKKQIIQQFVFETILVVCCAVVLSLMLVELSLPYYNSFLEKSLELEGSQFYLQLLGIVLVVILVAGIFPAVYVSNFETLKVLKGNFGRSKNGVWLRNGMLILQFTIATFFIIGSYIVYQQVNFMMNKELGFQGNQVIDISFRRTGNEGNFERYATIKKELMKIKGVQDVSAGTFNFSGSGATSTSGFNYKDVAVQGQNMAIDFGMLKMLDIKMLEGRNLSPGIASDTIDSVILNKTALDRLNEKEPLGKEISWNGNKLKIVGIADDFHLFGLHEKIPPMVFFHIKTIPWMGKTMSRVYVKMSPEDMEKTIAALEKFWTKKVDTDYPFKYDFVNKEFARTYAAYVKQRNLFALLNGVVILIALFGLFALASYSIERRMKEIAIRKTLGAETKTLLKELSLQYLIFGIIGFVAATFPVYYLLNKWLENFAFRITIAVSPFIIGFLVLMFLTLLIVLSKAYQATRVDVLRYLKYE